MYVSAWLASLSQHIIREHGRRIEKRRVVEPPLTEAELDLLTKQAVAACAHLSNAALDESDEDDELEEVLAVLGAFAQA